MKLLAVDSSGLTAAAAVYADGKIVAVNSVNNGKTHSQTLLPMIENVMDQAGIAPGEIDAIGVAKGPGSFTGLRIGASTVKGLAYAIGKPVVPVSTLEGLACNVAYYNGIICPIMDARRDQVYTAIYSTKTNRDEGGQGQLNENELKLTELSSPQAVAIDDILDECERLITNNTETSRVIFLGDGVYVHRKYIEERLGGKADFAMPQQNLQNAASVAVLAADLYEKGEYVDGAEFEPVYLRLSQAERERLEQSKK